jgi:CO/xanthine dehydrogenase FAD-binding subunit
MLVAALVHVAHFQIRNRGTVGGSIAHADPAAELPAVLLALDGSVEVASAGGKRRTIPASELFMGHFMTTLAPNEIVAQVDVPALPSNGGWGFHEVSRRHGDYAFAGAAALVTVQAGRIERAALALLGVAPTPVRMADAERALNGTQAGDPPLDEVAALVRAAVDPIGDIHGSAEYRRHVAGVVACRALRDAIERAPR